jgi:hypothetical protein
MNNTLDLAKMPVDHLRWLALNGAEAQREAWRPGVNESWLESASDRLDAIRKEPDRREREVRHG